jgi:DNA-directed RNA polymerase specialized sigma24 family protein
LTGLEQTYDRFRTTRWTEIRALGEGDEEERREAMEALIARYWPAVYAHLRARGQGREPAAELTQAFFAEVILDRDLFAKARPGRGKLRTLLLTALKRFRIDQHRRRAARGAEITIPMGALHMEDARLGSTRPGDDRVFERRWAMGLFEEALRRCENHFHESGRAAHWDLFEARVLRPAISGNEPGPLSEMPQARGFASAALAAAAVQVVKRRAMALLREVVAETVDYPADVEAELAQVRRFLLL